LEYESGYSVVSIGKGGSSRAAGAAIDFEAPVTAEQKRTCLLCLLRDRDEADSATQDEFVEAFRAAEKARQPIVEPEKWLTRVALNTCYPHPATGGIRAAAGFCEPIIISTS
jgi:hypothetical protein